MSFRISSRKHFLTYAQADGLTKDALLEFFKTKGNLDSYCIGEEDHVDGGTHFHCFLKYTRKISSVSTRFWDYQGFHPNIQRVGTRREDELAIVQYCQKEDPCPLVHNLAERKSWKDCVTAASRYHFLATVKEVSPRDYILQHAKIMDFADRFYAPPMPKFEPPSSPFLEPEELLDWRRTQLDMPRLNDRPVSLILIGESRLGKTQWARSLFPECHSYIAGTFSLEAISDSSCVYVWDDLPWDRIPCKKQFFGSQPEPFYLSDKYKGKRPVHLGGPSIYLCNSCPIFTEEHTWVQKNIKVIEIKDPLF